MKRVILSALLLFVVLAVNAQSKNGTICRLGFTYDISKSSNWGNNQPVITNVTPYSPAEQAGIKVADIIEAIDGLNTIDVKPEEIPQLLNRAGKNTVILTIKNLQQASRQVMVKKDCKKANAITEDQLASAFAMYNLENTNERLFTCPFKITTQDDIDFSQFKTYAFSISDESNEKLESVINECIGKELSKKGLTPSSENPDLLIQTFYFFDKNPNFKGENKVLVEKEPTYRYSSVTGKMEKYPFLNISAAEAEAEYLMQLGFRLVDRRSSDRSKLQVIWECESNELLSDVFKLEEYARTFVPLMCMQYPYVTYTRNVQYRVNFKTYNYTGISYDIDNLSLVVDVNPNSPAHAAGIRPRDIIEKIENQSLEFTPEEFSEGYKQFIIATMPYRDPKTIFTDANGFRRCMYWNTLDYPKVADAIKDKAYHSAFSYLYFYAPYINPTGTNACNFDVKRNKNKLNFIIRPTIRSEVSVQVN